MRRRHAGRAGFSLVETALAVAVVGVGILGVIGIFPVGVEMGRRAVRDSYTGMFAASLLDQIRADVQARPTLSLAELNARTFPIMVAGMQVRDLGGNPVTELGTSGGRPVPLVFSDPADPDVQDFVVWVRLEFLPATRLVSYGEQTFEQTHPEPDGPFTGTVFSEMPVGAMATVRLMLWGGEDPYFDVITRYSVNSATLQYYSNSGGGHRYSIYHNPHVQFFYADLYLVP